MVAASSMNLNFLLLRHNDLLVTPYTLMLRFLSQRVSISEQLSGCYQWGQACVRKNFSEEFQQRKWSNQPIIQCPWLSWKSSTLFSCHLWRIFLSFPAGWNGAVQHQTWFIKGHVFVFHPDTFLWLDRVVMPIFSIKILRTQMSGKNLLYKILSAESCLYYPHTQNLNSKQIKEINVQKRTHWKIQTTVSLCFRLSGSCETVKKYTVPGPEKQVQIGSFY